MKTTHPAQLILLGITVLGPCLVASPAAAQIGVHIGIGIPLPPPLVFVSPPQVVVLPQTYVYAVPDINEDVYFYDGFWWRPWQGRWYRSQYYDRGWGYYSSVPSFYRQVPQDWRREYQNHQWRGQTWNYQAVPHERVQQNWSTWKQQKYWESNQTWGVQGLKPQRQEHGRTPQAPRSQHQTIMPQNIQPQHQGRAPQASQPQRQGRESQVSQPQRQNRESQAAQPQHRGQQPQPQRHETSQPGKSRGNQAQAPGDKGHGQGKAAPAHDGKKDK